MGEGEIEDGRGIVMEVEGALEPGKDGNGELYESGY